MDSDFEEEDNTLGVTTCLPVAEGKTLDMEMNLPPVNGLDYLLRVRMEAQKCPATVTADGNFPSKPVQSVGVPRTRSTYNEGEHALSGCMRAPEGFAPSLDWQRKQISDFSLLRLKLSKYVSANKDKLVQHRKTLPDASDESGWCQFCFGNSLSEANEVNQVTANQPLLTTIASCDQTTLLCLLEYHVNWLQTHGFSTHQGQWFYSILSSIEKPLLPEICSLLRQLARLCSTIRATLESSNSDVLPQLNLLICLVGRYFDQNDIADS